MLPLPSMNKPREDHRLIKQYLDKNVYEATEERLDYLFREFDNIYVSFSGGKDSGLLLNLVLDFKRRNYPRRTVGSIR